MRLRAWLFAALLALACAAAPASANAASRSFSLSTSRTFAPGESIKIQLIAHNVPSLEFRVYKVRDPETFFAGLKDLHTFGVESYSPREQIDQRTFVERLHDFKAHLWWLIRHFFRTQFTDEARDTFREEQGKLGRRTRVAGLTEFAQIPLLNPTQLVARWVLQTPPVLVSETQQLPINGLAAGVYLIEATDGTYKAYTIAIVTQIAVVERTENGRAELYVADRISGAPVAAADVEMWADGHMQSSGKTDSDGMASLTMSGRDAAPGANPENVWIMARSGAGTAVLTPWGYGFGDQNQQHLKGYVYTDRPVYRPGHTVHIKGIVRKEVNDTLVLPGQRTLTLRVTGPDNKVVLEKEVPVSAHGTVIADLNLHTDTALGYYNIDLGQNVAAGGSFYVEDYKKPEYQVTVKPAVKRVLQGDSMQATIEARYFFGEPVAGARVTYVVHTSAHYWWDEDDNDEDQSGDGAEADSSDSDNTWGLTEQQEHHGVLDANGELTVTLPTQIDPKHNDQDYRIEARVTDAANREVAGHATVLATYGSFRVRVEPVSHVVESGQPVRVKVTAQDYDGHPVNTPVHLVAASVKWDSVTLQQTQTQAASLDASTGADGTVLADLPITGSGNFQVRVSAQTPENRTVEGRTWVWIWNGAGTWYQPNARAQIVADKKSYKVGDTAHLLLVTGLPESWAVVTTEGDSVQSRRLIHSTDQSIAFDVPITQQAQPNLVVDAVIVHNNQLITAQKSLSVPPVEQTLTITATPSKTQYEPGDRADFDVFAVDAQGKPVAADLSFGVVDEALYSVRPDMGGNIVTAFYPRRYVYLQPQTSFEFYFYGQAGKRSPLLARLGDGLYHPRMAQVKPGSDLVVPKVRKAFPDTAYWNPDVRTGPDGHAQVEFNFPDALTTWRTTIRAMTDDSKAGGVVTRVLVRKNLIVRLAAPRFFRQGDKTVLRVIAHNYLATAKDVTFALDVSGLDVIGGQTRTVTIPAKGESYVDWRVKARATGSAVLTAKALTNDESDALQITLPVLPFGVKQRVASAGVVFSGAGQNQWSYSFPPGSDPGSRSLTITVAPSVAGTVFDALDYLTSYPWGCTEQTMSSFLPDLIVAQAVDTLHLKSTIDPRTLNDMVNAGIQRLATYQHDDGGWGWWPDDPSRVFMTAYVISGLSQAKAAGYTIDESRFNRGRAWLAGMLAAHPDMIPDLRAYTVYALAVTGGAPQGSLDTVWA
ncbi:MAG: MG2 domain-containing protein, partial [Terracidiphilus sp.]